MSRTRAFRVAAAVVLTAAVSAVGCSEDSNPAGPVTGADVTITIVGNSGSMSFSPNPASVRVGQTVAWHNADGTTHTATDDGGAFDTGNIPSGSTSSPIQMGTAGSFPYHCSPHPTMVGTLTVNP